MSFRALVSDLLLAIESGRWNELEIKIKAGNFNMEILLFEAIRAADADIVKVLLENVLDIDVNYLDNLVGTPLHVAAKIESAEKAFEICKLLVDHGADVSIQEVHRKRTPLAIVCDRADCSPEFVELLLSETSVHVKDEYDKLAHYQAACKQNMAVLSALLDFEDRNNVKLSEHEANKLIYECTWRGVSEDLLQQIYDRYSEMIIRRELENPFLLYCLVSRCQKVLAKRLLEAGVNPLTISSPGEVLYLPGSWIPLNVSLQGPSCGCFSLISKYITSERIATALKQPDFINPLQTAVEKSKVIELEALLELGFDYQSFENTFTSGRFLKADLLEGTRLYLKLVSYKHSKMLSHMLLNSDNDANVEHFAKCLLSRGASANVAGKGEMSPLVALALRIHDDVGDASEHHSVIQNTFKLLVNNGADVFHKSSASAIESPDLVIIAAVFGDIPFIFYLITRVGFSIVALLDDLKFILTDYGAMEELARRSVYLREQLRNRVATIANLCLTLRVNCNYVKSICRDLNSLAFVAAVADRRSAFDPVYAHFRTIPSLQQMCRSTIGEHLSESPAAHGFQETKIEQLNIPPLIKSYLQYEDITDERLQSEFAAPSVLEIDGVVYSLREE